MADEDSGRYLCTAAAMNPGHVGNRLFSNAFRSVHFGGLKRHWWMNFTRDSLDVRAWMLCGASVSLGLMGDCASRLGASGIKGKTRRPVVVS